LQQWLTGRHRIRPSTRHAHQERINLYLLPGLGHLPAVRLTTADIDRLYAAMRVLGRPDQDTVKDRTMLDRLLAARRIPPRRPISPASIARTHAVLRAALNTAVRRGLLPVNVATHVELEPERRPPVSVWNPEQLGAFLDGIDGDRLQAGFHLVGYHGLRRGEVCGLRWPQLDLDASILRVTRQTVQVGRETFDGEPKTKAGGRVLFLDRRTVAVLRVHKARQNRERLAAGAAYVDHGLVFCREDGSPYKPESVSQHFERCAARLGLPRITLHQLRHTSASIGLAAGETLKEVSDRLGHSGIGITADTYIHVLPALARDSAERRAAAIPRAVVDVPDAPRQDHEPISGPGASTRSSPPPPEEVKAQVTARAALENRTPDLLITSEPLCRLS